ncbi:MAG: acyl-CoA carboxylase subunit beta, partial [Solirubrobacteraceae bacterium]
MGPGFGVGTNLAALSDFVVMVRGTSTLGMSAAPFVEAATGERLTNEQIGGADVQARNGVADLAVDDEDEALDAIRAFLGFLPSSADGTPPRIDGPHAPADVDLDAIVPTDTRQVYDARDLVTGLADADSVLELRGQTAPNVVTSLARIDGRPVGVIANQPLHLGGALDSAACEKAAHFVAVCDAFGLPLVVLIDLPGFLIGTAAESTQLARRSGRLIYELAQATVPRFTIVVRKGYGAAYIAMGGGRSYSADLALAWPTAEICSMPVEGAVDIAYRREVEAADDPAAHREALIARFRANIDPFAAADGFGIDDVVEPSRTRTSLVEALGRVTPRRPPRVPGKRRTISPI